MFARLGATRPGGAVNTPLARPPFFLGLTMQKGEGGRDTNNYTGDLRGRTSRTRTRLGDLVGWVGWVTGDGEGWTDGCGLLTFGSVAQREGVRELGWGLTSTRGVLARAHSLVLRAVPEGAEQVLCSVGNVGGAADERRPVVVILGTVRGLCGRTSGRRVGDRGPELGRERCSVREGSRRSVL
jgi:hypothetical protein